MAINVKGDITYVIGANNTGFSRAIGDTKKQLNSLSKSSSAVKAVNLAEYFAGSATAALSMATAIGAGAVAVANSAREASNLARQAGLSVNSFNALDFAARQYGVTGEQVADITKDIKDRAQEFARDGTGAFEDLRNELGLTKEEGRELASQMVEMSGDKAIGLMIKRMEDLGLSGNKMTQALESMGNDLSRIYPLFADNATESNRLKNSFGDIVATVTDKDTKRLRTLAENTDLAGKSFSVLTQVTVSEYFTTINPLITDAAKGFSRLAEQIRVVGLAQAVLNTFSNTSLREQHQELVKDYQNAKAALDEYAGVDVSKLPSINPFGKSKNEFNNLQVDLVLAKKNLKDFNDNQVEYQKSISDAVGESIKGYDELLKRISKTSSAEDGGKGGKGGSGTGGGSSQADKEAAQKSLDILTKSVQTEQQRLDERKKQFKEYYKAQLIDETQYKAAKDALAIQQEGIDERAADAAKRTAEREQQVRQQRINAIVQFSSDLSDVNPNDVLISQLEALDDVYGDSIEKDRAYYEARKQIRNDFLESIGANEEPDFGGGAIGSLFSETETEKIDARNAKLEEAYASDKLSFQEYQTAKDNIEQQYNANRVVQTDKALSSLATLQSSHSKKAQAVGKAAAIAQTTISTYQSATEAYKSMAGIPVVGPVLGAAAAAAAVAAGLANVQKIRGAKAVGGQISANTAEPYLVGEKGAELFVPNQAGNIIPNSQLGGGGTTNVNISAVDAAGVEQLLLENTDLILGLVREA